MTKQAPVDKITLYEPRPLAPLPSRTVPVRLPRIQAPVVPAPIQRAIAKLPVPVPPPPVAKAKPLPEPPQIEAAQAIQPKIDLPPAPAPAPARPAVHTDVLASALPAVPAPKAQPAVHTGGFGDPNGVHAAANSALSRLAQVGAFDMPAGSGNGGGSGKARVVAMAGFGDGGSGGGGNGPGGTGHGAVRASGFGDYRADAPAKVQAVAAVSPAQTPVEILSKPRPVYTPEARAKGLEGEVELEVVFCGNGSIRVNRVVRGLGLGLDESARAAAAQIRFRPGTRAGVPVDMTGIVHIVFELS